MSYVNVGEIVMITKGNRVGSKAKVLQNLNGHAIRAQIISGEHKDEILEKVRFDHYDKLTK